MKEGPDIAGITALIGDPARANMLTALMSGLALTAGELAREAGITPPTASAHLAHLRDGGLVVVTVQGRHRYHRLAGPDIAAALEAVMGLAARTGRLRTRPGPRDQALRHARICYNHLAGAMGVRLHDALLDQGSVVATPAGLALSPPGRARLLAEGIDLDASRPPICAACLDWSERRPHLSGRLGAALLQHFLARGWLHRAPDSRAALFTRHGEAAFAAFLAPAAAAAVA